MKSSLQMKPSQQIRHLLLEFSEALKIKSVTLYSMDGKKQKEWKIDNQASPVGFEVNNVLAGVYILSIESEAGMYYRKVLSHTINFGNEFPPILSKFI